MDKVKAIVENLILYFLKVLAYFEFEGVDVKGFEDWMEANKGE